MRTFLTLVISTFKLIVLNAVTSKISLSIYCICFPVLSTFTGKAFGGSCCILLNTGGAFIVASYKVKYIVIGIIIIKYFNYLP